MAVLGAVLPTVSRAQNINLVSQLDPFPGNDRYGDVWGEGNYAYLGSFQGAGVAIIDLSDPGSPFLAATYSPASGGQFKDVKVDAGIGYFSSDNGGGLHIVDLSDPTSPSLLSQITSAAQGFNSIHNVFVSSGYVYEADSRTPTVKVFDVSDPQNPFFVRNITTPDTRFIHDVTVRGGRLYASGFQGFTYIYDVSDVGSTPPPLLGSVSSGINSHASWVTSDGRILISAREISDGDVRIFDITDPGAPVLLSTIDRTSLGIDAFSPHNPLLFSDTLLFVSWYQAGVQAIDLSDPSNPVAVGSYDTFPGAVSGFDGNWGVYPFLGLDRVLASDLDGALFILDASALPAFPVPALGWRGLAGFLLIAAAGIAGRRRPRRRAGGGMHGPPSRSE
jgi:choice-of-anchor B domain-containing protein